MSVFWKARRGLLSTSAGQNAIPITISAASQAGDIIWTNFGNLGARNCKYVPFVAYLRKNTPVFDAAPGLRRGADATLAICRGRMPGACREKHLLTMLVCHLVLWIFPVSGEICQISKIYKLSLISYMTKTFREFEVSEQSLAQFCPSRQTRAKFEFSPLLSSDNYALLLINILMQV